MAISKRGDFWNPQKCPWNFEKFQSDLERRMMLRLENDPHVRKWMKRHRLSFLGLMGKRTNAGTCLTF
jgi:hypothetical protein